MWRGVCAGAAGARGSCPGVGPAGSRTRLALLVLGAMALGAGGLWAQPASFAVDPVSITFGNVPAGTTVSQKVTVTNQSGVDENFTVANLSNAFSASPNSFTIAGSGPPVVVTISFKPAAPFTYTDTILFSASGMNLTAVSHVVSVSGTGTGSGGPATFILSSSSIPFGTVNVGTAPTQTFTITNTTQASVPVTFSISTTGAGFTASLSTSTLTFEDQAIVTVTFAPDTAATFTGQVTITASAPGFASSTQQVALSGRGILPFTAAPSALNFGNILIGCSSTQIFTVTAAISLSFQLQSTNAAFTLSSTSFNNTQTLTVTFSPKAPGALQGSIRIAAFAQGEPVGNATIAVTGTGVDVVLSPNALSFGAVSVGSSSSQTVQLTNNPAGQENYQYAVSSSNPAFTSSAVSATGSAQITFTASAAGPASGTITYTITDPGSAVSCPLIRTLAVSGTGVMIALSPTSIDFGTVAIGVTSPAKTATLTNNTGIDFTGAAASSNPAFSPAPAQIRLPNGQSQAFGITFKPPAAGPQTGTITFSLTGAAPGSTAPVSITMTLALTGQGQTPAELTVAPAQINFGDVAVGSTATQTVSVSNPGGTSADVTVATAAPFAVSAASFTLAAGASETVSVRFTPAGAGAFEGTATFSIAGATRTVALSGRGGTPVLSYMAGPNGTSISPGGSFPPLPPTNIGASSSVPFRISNTGTVPATVSSATTSDPAFSLTESQPLPATLAPGSALDLQIHFSPTQPGPASATLSVNGQTFNLSGAALLTGAAITGAGGAVQPAQQPQVGITLPQSYAVPITGQLSLSFSPAALYGDDPLIQFMVPSGGACPNSARPNGCVTFTIPAGSKAAVFTGGGSQIAFQSGTVAGTIQFQVTFRAGGVDVTPAPVPSASVNVVRAAPVIQSVTSSKTSSGLQAVITAFATTREVNTVTVQFTPASGANLATTSLTLDVGSQFATWYAGAGAAYGSLFQLTIPFTLQGNANAVAKISVTLANGDGKSAAVAATVSP